MRIVPTFARAAVLLLVAFDAAAASRASQEVTLVGTGTVWRRSNTRNERGIFTPPFKDAIISTFFPAEPRVGEKVTVIPDNAVAPFDLRILSVKRYDIPELEHPWWEANLEPVEAGPLLTAPPRADRHEEYPIGVIVIYPAVEGAQGIAPAKLDEASLPSTTRHQFVHMVADLDADGSADVLVVEFCCKNSEKDAKNGCTDYDDYVCGEIFLKKSGVWERVRETRPF